jgi:hypothetical protein
VQEEQGVGVVTRGAVLGRQRPESSGNGRAQPVWHVSRGGGRGSWAHAPQSVCVGQHEGIVAF